MNDPMSISGVDDFASNIKCLMEKYEKAIEFIRDLSTCKCGYDECLSCSGRELLKELDDE